MDGEYTLQLTVNPEIELEHYYSNNTLLINFDVIADNVHPILDVTFDGAHIMDYDIVSAKPEIVINMKDENKFLLKDDSSGVDVFLKIPNAATFLLLLDFESFE